MEVSFVAIRIGSNTSSIQAQRRLSDASLSLSKTYERLSSGQRINQASDDAAGLSIADSLKAGRKVYTQGVRNLNDGISTLQIADSAVENLSQIVTRIRELAEQAANGAYSSTQRKALDSEAQALEKEYFRISRSAVFNGTNLFDGSLSQGLRLQGGFGIEGSIQSSLGGVMGDGTFIAKTPTSTESTPYSVALGDLNGDGVLDIVTADCGAGVASVSLGMGDGSFSAKTSYSTGGYPASVTLGDVNGDGVLDIVTADTSTSSVSVLLGRGDGSFSNKTSYATGFTARSVALGDLNGDGRLDMVAGGDGGAGTVSVFLGSGDGTFIAAASYSTGALVTISVALKDLNRDGVLDMVTADYTANTASVFLGRGDGTFSSETSYASGDNAQSVVLGDVNGDGAEDIVTADYYDSTVSVLLGRGDGTFLAKTSYSTGARAKSAVLGDVNGDGLQDIVTANYGGNTAAVLLGKGGGTFSAPTEYSTGVNPYSVALGDLNGDGVLDLVTANYSDNTASVLLGDTREGISPLLPFSLATQADALQAMAPLDRKLSQLAEQRGVIGAFQSRLSVAVNTLQSTSENYESAESRIRDADVASDAAELARLQISQQAATAILAQANQAPSLAIRLLRVD